MNYQLNPEFSKDGPYGQEEGIEVWRIENLLPERVSKETYGTFFSGDSYIVLHTKKKGTAFSWDVYFWLGRDTTVDESGAAALKTVDLDDSLGGEPVQYREVQGFESKGFLSIFKSGVQYQDGGVDSAFNHVDRDAFTKRLLHIKGRKAVRVTSVEVSVASMNQGDCFILDCGKKIYQWNGTKANRMEKTKSLDVTLNIREAERKGRAEIVVIEAGQEPEEFWEELGGQGTISDDGGDDDAVSAVTTETKLYHMSDESGELEINEQTDRPLHRNMLNENDSHILVCEKGLFSWVGKQASREERRQAMIQATKFVQQYDLPSWTPIAVLNQGHETPQFKQFFRWPEALSAEEGKAKKEKKAVDVAAMHASTAESEQEVNDFNGVIKNVWRIENFEKSEVPEWQYGQFWSGDSFIVLYEYENKAGKKQWIIYFWQGIESSSDEKGASALLATELDDAMGGDPVQVRVVQGKEPNHFLKIFNGKFVVHKGGVPGEFGSGEAQGWEYETDGLFRCRGTSSGAAKAVEVDCEACHLNSNDAFILNTPPTESNKQWIWIGAGASEQEQEVATNIGGLICGERASTLVMEGEEDDEFWTALGGKAEYSSDPSLAESDRDPRLFHGSNVHDGFQVEEIFNFDQSDLDFEDVFILDSWAEVFVWIGSRANREERQQAMETAVAYLKADEERGDTPVTVVQQGNEPMMFTCHFPLWDVELARMQEDPYQKKLREAGESTTQSVEESLGDFNRTYTYDELLTRPANCDPCALETYLSDEEFATIFKMDKEAFNKLAKWKRDGEKKKVKLF